MNRYPGPNPRLSVVQDMGVNAPVYHQRTIASLVTGLTLEFRAGHISHEPLPEMMVGEYSSPTPDVVLYHEATETAPVIIEVCQTRGVKADINEVIGLIDGNLYGIIEGFVYDYKTSKWLRYRKSDGGLTTESSFSDLLNLDLSRYV